MENEENVSTLVWSARRHAADSALEVLVLCVDELRQACDLL